MVSFKVFTVTPSSHTQFDSLTVRAGEAWQEVLDQVEMSLDQQFCDKPWDEIECTIKCSTMTEEEWNELELPD